MDEVLRYFLASLSPPIPSLMHPGPVAETPPPRGGVTGWLMSCSALMLPRLGLLFFSKRAATPASSCASGPRVGVTCTEPDINM